MGSNLLLDDKPLIVLPGLAVKIGLNESIFLQQLHYWLRETNNEMDGYKWVYNTYAQWCQQFPFWSESTIRRTIGSLEKAGLLITGDFNKYKFDKTRWYRINFENLERLNRPSVQNEQMEEVNLNTSDLFKMNRPIPENTIDYLPENTNNTSAHPSVREDEDVKVPYKKIIDYLNDKTGKKYSHKSDAHKKLMRARFAEGFTLEDFLKVIDNKVRQWKHSPTWEKYLRPTTLFAAKHFDNYLNEGDNGESTGPDISQYDFTKNLPSDF